MTALEAYPPARSLPRPAGHSFPVTLHVGAQPLQITVADLRHDPRARADLLATYIETGAITCEECAHGRSVIVNWAAVQAVVF